MVRSYRMGARAKAVDETRRRIVVAATELFALRPFDLVSYADVAKRSGIGIATVVRQFETKERLFAGAVEAARQVLDTDTASLPVGDPAAMVKGTVEGYERFGDVIVRLLAQEERVPLIRETLAHGRKVHHTRVAHLFGGVLGKLRGRARQVRFAQLMAATDVLFWKLLRRDLRLTRRETEQAMLEMVEALCR
jgi:AcrR family transcriptional regulator